LIRFYDERCTCKSSIHWQHWNHIGPSHPATRYLLGWICLDCGDVVLAMTSRKDPVYPGEFDQALAAGDDRSIAWVWDRLVELKAKANG